MTTEILVNKLFQIKSNTPQPKTSISFEMDIENELACVVFDEIHMINDQARGHVWEQSIMMLPKQVQIIGLSATLDNPEKFAIWMENKGEFSVNPEKIVYTELLLKSNIIWKLRFIKYNKIYYTNNKITVIKNSLYDEYHTEIAERKKELDKEKYDYVFSPAAKWSINWKPE